MKWQKRPPLKIFAKKDPTEWRHPRAAWANAGKGLPPFPIPACCRCNVTGQPLWGLPPMEKPACPRGKYF
jgi:hypothetical protein